MKNTTHGHFEKLRLLNLQQLELLDSNPDPVLDELVKLAAAVTNSPISALSFVDKDRQWFKSKFGFTATETPRDESFSTYTILHPLNPLIINDASESPLFREYPFVKSGEIRSYVGIPINSPEFEFTIGSLSILDCKPREYTEDELLLLKSISHSIEVYIKGKWEHMKEQTAV